MPWGAAPRGLLLRGNQAMELIGFRAAECPTTLAVSPSLKLLALATAAAGGDNCGGASSRIDLMRLWREEGEQELRRPLKAVASIPDFGRVVHRLAWSRGVATSRYPLGLLAGGLDGGAVHIWDPSYLTYEPDTDTSMEGDEFSFHLPLSLQRALSPNSLSAVEERLDMQFKDKRIEDAAADMIAKMNALILEHGFKERPIKSEIKHDSEDDWEIIQQEEIVPEGFKD